MYLDITQQWSHKWKLNKRIEQNLKNMHFRNPTKSNQNLNLVQYSNSHKIEDEKM